ncbi:phosphoglycerate kinase [Blastochloris viridis]|uniref:Phosphoglycerate kinase n=1 Tax=Blastochloris viridis TaxID=1079 RepID=A0A0H5BP33_BLAVI|nr:phosphoglycerate kinase [Blastochloris viridis]ALK08052.1 Phosphoglycerate kinase [Blastochloris viridis]BAR98688.1 phosphoglycerate kinase [Blastochloris viridis]CUU43974.1 Phosphoglycerate kinase [Blastochloris viridis]
MTAFRTLDDADVAGKRVLVRVDLNVPMENGAVADATRIERVIPTIKEISEKGGKVILLAHFGRPKGIDPTQSLKVIVPALADRLGKPVAFADDCIGEPAATAIAAMQPGDILLLENTRFHKEEEKNDPDFTKALAANGDIWVNEAFSAAHRAHASTEGLGHILPAYAGRTMQAELDALSKALEAPTRPVAAIVGGAKVSTKLDLLGNLTAKVDVLIIGGAMANTFLFAEGKAIGKSLCEREMADTARAILKTAAARGCTVVLPVDVVTAAEFKANAPSKTVTVDAIGADDMVLDIGPKSVLDVTSRLASVKTALWNGPFGAFELEPFDRGTVQVAKAVAELTQAGKVVSVAGGGDTVSALNHAGVASQFSYVSTAGGAFLEFLEGKALPGVEVLRKR